MNTWRVIRTPHLTRELLIALLKNEIGAICIPGFASDEVCQKAVRAIYAYGIDYYKDKHPKVGKVGITQSEYKHNLSEKEEYFDKVPAANQGLQTIFDGDRNLLSDVIDSVRSAWGENVGIAFEESLQKPYFAGLVRVINTEGEEERITFSSFIGLLGKTGRLIFWS